MAAPKIRDALPADVDGLARLESSSFDTDRLAPRSFRRLIAAPTAACRVAVSGDALAGYYVLLFRAGSNAARLYSVAVDPGHRGGGLAKALLADAEVTARACGARRMRLEVRRDNDVAIRLYERRGYRPIARRAGYYADGGDALVCEKNLDPGSDERGKIAEEDRSPRDSLVRSAYIEAATGANSVAPRVASISVRSLAETAAPPPR